MQSISEATAVIGPAVAAKPAEMRKLILKLRWIGLDDEAERLSESLAEFAPVDCPIMGPRETD